MPSSLYCVEHAMNEQLVIASSVCDGRTACADHAASANSQVLLIEQRQKVDQCEWCLRAMHRAYFVVDQQTLCIRHAADAVFPQDDMGAHNMAHAAYLRLQAAGVVGAY